jgi:uncharacterized lipoprotein YajG
LCTHLRRAQEAKIIRPTLLAGALLFAGCASEPTQTTQTTDGTMPQRKSLARICATEPVTGSHINRSDRSGVQVVTPEAFGEMTNRAIPNRIGD